MSTATTVPAASPTAVVIRPMPSGSAPRCTRMVIEWEALGMPIWAPSGAAGRSREAYSSHRAPGLIAADLLVWSILMAGIATIDWIDGRLMGYGQAEFDRQYRERFLGGVFRHAISDHPKPFRGVGPGPSLGGRQTGPHGRGRAAAADQRDGRAHP